METKSEEEVRSRRFTNHVGSHPLAALGLYYLDAGNWHEDGEPAPFSSDDLREFSICWENAQDDARDLLAEAKLPIADADRTLVAANTAFQLDWDTHKAISNCWFSTVEGLKPFDGFKLRLRKDGDQTIGPDEKARLEDLIAELPTCADRKLFQLAMENVKFSLRHTIVTDGDLIKKRDIGLILYKYNKKFKSLVLAGTLAGGDLTNRLTELFISTGPLWAQLNSQVHQDDAKGIIMATKTKPVWMKPELWSSPRKTDSELRVIGVVTLRNRPARGSPVSSACGPGCTRSRCTRRCSPSLALG